MCVIDKACYWSSSFSFFLGAEINKNAKLMDPRGRPMVTTYAACWSSNNIINMSDGVGSV